MLDGSGPLWEAASPGVAIYLWWRPGAAPAGTTERERTILVRTVRHHDATDDPLAAGDVRTAYRVWNAAVLVDASEPCSPFGPEQRVIAASTAAVRLVRGPPGTGKTTSLLLAAAARSESDRILYVTRSARLAGEAMALLAGFGRPAGTTEVLTLKALFLQLAPDRGPLTDDAAWACARTGCGGWCRDARPPRATRRQHARK